MKISNITPWIPDIEHEFCEEFWQLDEGCKVRKYTSALSRRVVDILGSMGLYDDHAFAVQLFLCLKNNDKIGFVNLLTQKDNKHIGAIVRCIQKRAKNLSSAKGLPWTGKYYRFRRPDILARTFLSAQEEVTLYKELFGIEK